MAEIIKNEAGFATSKIEVSKKHPTTGKYEKQGEVTIFVPTLDLFGLQAEVKEVGDDGLPVYADRKLDYLFSAVLAAVKAKARNSLVSGTAELKAGVTIPADFDALLAEAERGGGAEALAVVRDLKAQMANWISNVQKKSAGTSKLVTDLFGNRNALSLQSDANKEKMKGYIAGFAEWLGDENVELLEKGQKYLESLIAAASTEVSTEDF